MMVRTTESDALRTGPGSVYYGAVANEPTFNQQGTTVDAQIKAAQPTPLNKGQIAILALARVCEPLTFSILFPFVQQMIVDTGEVKVEDVGYAVGLVEASFSWTQFFSLMFWARAADSWGRKPVLILALVGSCLATTLFGFSSHVWQMYASRFVAGAFGGGSMVIRTLFTENCDRTNQAVAFSFFAAAANVGGLLGPTMGGFLSNPVTEYPGIFGGSALLKAYPYALPGLVCGTFCALAIALCVLFLDETRPAECDKPIPIRQVLSPPLIRMLAIFSWSVAVVFSLNALFPLYLFTPVPLGGQGKSPRQIAQVGVMSACFQAFWLLLVMPRLDRWLGTRKMFCVVSAMFPLQMINPVLANVFARRGNVRATNVMIGIYASVGQLVMVSFTSVQLLLNLSIPPGTTAAVNGIAAALSGIVKSTFPAAVNSLFALSVSKQLLHGYLAWLVMGLMASGVFILSFYTPVDREDPKDDAEQRGRVMEAESEALDV